MVDLSGRTPRFAEHHCTALRRSLGAGTMVLLAVSNQAAFAATVTATGTPGSRGAAGTSPGGAGGAGGAGQNAVATATGSSP